MPAADRGAMRLAAAVIGAFLCAPEAKLAAGRKGASGSLIFVGGAGCDADDSQCARVTEDAGGTVWGFSLTPEHTLAPTLNVSVPSLSAWLTAAPEAPHCLFAVLVLENKVAAFEVSGSAVKPRGDPVPSGGVNPVFASVSKDGGVLLAANYHGPDNATESRGASVASFKIATDCSLTPAAVVHHDGSSVVHGRQDSAHPHCIVSARGGVAYACDLGQDIIFTYGVAADGGLKERHRVHAAKGDGPRHLVEHPAKPLAFVVNELTSTVATYAIQGDGKLEIKAHVSTLPRGAPLEGTKAGEIAIAPGGSIVYASNRGLHNTICVLRVYDDGTLKQIQQVHVPAYPRGMTLTPDGTVLLVAGQHLGVMQAFNVKADGRLSSTGEPVTAAPTAATIAVVPTGGTEPKVITS